jgi:hypothetical protein
MTKANGELWGIVAANGERFTIYAEILTQVGDWLILANERTGEASADDGIAMFFRPFSATRLNEGTTH